MRRSKLFLLLPLVAAAPMAAQGFEGTVTYKMAGSQVGQPNDMTITVAIKGGMSATTFTANAGPMGPMEGHIIFDSKTNSSTMLMPMPAGMGGQMAAMNGGVEPKGLKIVTDLSKPVPGAPDVKVDVKKLGTSETIAGYKCDDYEVSSDKGPATRMCVTHDLGTFVFPGGGGMGGRRGGGSGSPAWTKAFATMGGFPLKVWSADGKPGLEVTSITKGSVPPGSFSIPDGYMDMGNMRGMMGGRGGGGR